MKVFIISVFILFNLVVGKTLAQEEAAPQYRFYFDLTTYSILEDPVNKPLFGWFGGLQFKMGNDWYLNRGDFHGVLKFTWLRFGLHLSDDVSAGIFFSPLNLGLGHQFQLKNKFSITPSFSACYYIFPDDIFIPDWIDGVAFASEVAFNFNDISCVVEYSQKAYHDFYTNDIEGHFRYIGLSLRSSLTRIVK